MPRSTSTSHVVHAPPDDVFATVTDVRRLPEWNAAMTRVVEAPDDLAVGAEWVVEFHALGRTWRSRARVDDLDREGRRFTYRSGTDDGNASWARWTWAVDQHPEGSLVRVGFELHPVTFWRRILLAGIRARQLSRREIPASLAALESAVRPSSHDEIGADR